LLSQAEYQLSRCDPGSVSAQRLLAQIERLTLGIPHGRRALEDEDADEPEPTNDTPVKTFTLGMRVTQRDKAGVLHTGEVTAVAADGSPTFKEIL
jgi:hypothetical protein